MKKNRLNGVLLLMLSLLLMGCPSDSGSDGKDDVIISSERIELSPTTVEFSSAKGVQQSVRLSANCKWTITNIPNWLIVNPKEGSGDASLMLETAEANTGNERSVQLKISGLDRSVSLTVRQRGDGSSGENPPVTDMTTLTTSTTSLTFTASETSTRNFTVTVSPATAAITVQSSNTNVCTVSVTGTGTQRTITVTPNVNSSNVQRTSTITITATASGSTASKTVSVIQQAATGGAPVITSFSIGEVTSSSFKFSMNFTSDPASDLYGVCYSKTNTTPTMSDNRTYWSTSTTGLSFTGTVNHDILVAGTTYYVRAFVVNSYGTTYSSSTLTVTLPAANPNMPGSGDNPVPNLPSRRFE